MVVLDHTIAGAETEAGALADNLGSVEGIEDPVGFANAGSGVEEFQNHILILGVNASKERSAASFFQRVGGIADDLQAALKQLIGISPHSRHAGFNRCFYSNALALQAQHFHFNGAMHERADLY